MHKVEPSTSQASPGLRRGSLGQILGRQLMVQLPDALSWRRRGLTRKTQQAIVPVNAEQAAVPQMTL